MSRGPVVSLKRCPAQRVRLTVRPDNQGVITLGDLHASIRRLAHCLVTYGFWEIEEEPYLRLLAISQYFSDTGSYELFY